MGFSGFFGRRVRVFKRQARVRIRLGGILGYSEKRKPGEIEILKIPPILKTLILTKTRDPRPFTKISEIFPKRLAYAPLWFIISCDVSPNLRGAPGEN